MRILKETSLVHHVRRLLGHLLHRESTMASESSYGPSQYWSDTDDKPPTPSDGVHHTRKRGRSHDDWSPTSSGGVHPTKEREHSQSSTDSEAKLVLLFNDSPTYHQTYKNAIIKDSRAVIEAAIAERIAEQLKADIVFNVGTYSSHGFQWQAQPRNKWKETTAGKKQVLAKPNEATITTLTRPLHLPGDIQEVQVILARIIKGKATQLDTHFKPEMREIVAYGLFDMLIHTKQPALVLANVGMSIVSMMNFVREYHGRKSTCADQHICIIHDKDKQVICLALDTFAQARKMATIVY